MRSPLERSEEQTTTEDAEIAEWVVFLFSYILLCVLCPLWLFPTVLLSGTQRAKGLLPAVVNV
jgi:hypothetical protein